MKRKEFAKKLIKYNGLKDSYNLTKAAEEFSELATVLLQFVNKPTKITPQQVIDEIGDAEIRLDCLKELFNKQEVKRRKAFKRDKFETYMKEKIYKKI